MSADKLTLLLTLCMINVSCHYPWLSLNWVIRVSVEHARGSGRRGRDGGRDDRYDRDRGSRRGGGGNWMDK